MKGSEDTESNSGTDLTFWRHASSKVPQILLGLGVYFSGFLGFRFLTGEELTFDPGDLGGLFGILALWFAFTFDSYRARKTHADDGH